MIGKAKSCVGGFSLFSYVIDDEKGIEILRNNLCGETPIDLFREMKILQDLNQKATNKLISLVLSPHVDDGEKLSRKQLQNLTKEFLKELEIDTNQAQFIAFMHTEKRHCHIHILLNRVNEKGKLLKDHHIGKKAQWGAHRVAEKNELISAKQMRIDKIKASDRFESDFKNLRKEMYQKHLNVMATKPKTIENYLAKMLNEEMKFIPTINRQGELQGFRVRDMESQTEMKASDIHRNMGLKNLIDSGLFFQDDNFNLSKSMHESNQKSFQSFKKELEIIAIKNKLLLDSKAFETKIVDKIENAQITECKTFRRYNMAQKIKTQDVMELLAEKLDKAIDKFDFNEKIITTVDGKLEELKKTSVKFEFEPLEKVIKEINQIFVNQRSELTSISEKHNNQIKDSVKKEGKQ